MSPETLGNIAFQAYCASVGNVTHDGKPIPKWDNLTTEVRTAWEVSADAVGIAFDSRYRELVKRVEEIEASLGAL